MLLWDVCLIDFALSLLSAMLDSNCIYIHVAIDHEHWIHIEVIVAFCEQTDRKIVLLLSGGGIVGA